MILKRVDHVEIIPRDPERTIDFYANILNFRIKNRHLAFKILYFATLLFPIVIHSVPDHIKKRVSSTSAKVKTSGFDVS